MVLIAILVLFSASAHAEDMPAGADTRDPFGFADFGEAAEPCGMHIFEPV